MDEIEFHPVYSLARNRFDSVGFNLEMLPMQITEDVTLEDISSLLSEESFSTWKGYIGTNDFERLEGIRFALVRRFDSSTNLERSSQSVENAMACLRLIRPMRAPWTIPWAPSE